MLMMTLVLNTKNKYEPDSEILKLTREGQCFLGWEGGRCRKERRKYREVRQWYWMF